MPEFENFEELDQLVRNSKGVLTVRMEQLRDAYGAGRLGRWVRQGIGKELAQRGLAHFPAELPENQWRHVRIYKNGTPAADLVQALMEPGKDGDEIIRQSLNGEAQDKLLRIRGVLED